MADLNRLRSVLDTSSDERNPSAQELQEIIEDVRVVAVIGMSRDPAKAARRVPSYMATKGYEVIPVNPYADRILGRTAYPTLDDVEEELDMALIFRPSDQVAPFLTAAASREENPVVWLQEGIRDDQAAQEAREGGTVVIQDLCFFKAHRALGEGRRTRDGQPA